MVPVGVRKLHGCKVGCEIIPVTGVCSPAGQLCSGTAWCRGIALLEELVEQQCPWQHVAAAMGKLWKKKISW